MTRAKPVHPRAANLRFKGLGACVTVVRQSTGGKVSRNAMAATTLAGNNEEAKEGTEGDHFIKFYIRGNIEEEAQSQVEEETG